MKIIDLLNKMAKGEEMPELIKYDGCKYIYEKSVKNYERTDLIEYLFNEYDITSILNDEVVILEEVEDKEYEEIEEIYTNTTVNLDVCETFDVLEEKINALIRNQKYILERLDK